jgi:hypothetical protein
MAADALELASMSFEAADYPLGGRLCIACGPPMHPPSTAKVMR